MARNTNREHQAKAGKASGLKQLKEKGVAHFSWMGKRRAEQIYNRDFKADPKGCFVWIPGRHLQVLYDWLGSYLSHTDVDVEEAIAGLVSRLELKLKARGLVEEPDPVFGK